MLNMVLPGPTLPSDPLTEPTDPLNEDLDDSLNEDLGDSLNEDLGDSLGDVCGLLPCPPQVKHFNKKLCMKLLIPTPPTIASNCSLLSSAIA
jgi:hypothetical protein